MPQKPVSKPVLVECRAEQMRSAEQAGVFLQPSELQHHRITGDGSCMFRALVQGNHLVSSGCLMSHGQEYQAALDLRQAVVAELKKNRRYA